MRVLALLFAVLVVGCNDGTRTGPAPEPKPPAEVKSAPEPAQAEPAKPEPNPDEPAQKAGYNGSRIHQLYELKTCTVTIGTHRFKAWIMDDDSKRTEGMMFLTSPEVKDTEGMIFAFPDELDRSFWMRNTLIDLDIAYIRKDGTIVSVSPMKALDETGVPSGKPAMYAFEVKGGTFKKLGIKAGMKASFQPKPVGK